MFFEQSFLWRQLGGKIRKFSVSARVRSTRSVPTAPVDPRSEKKGTHRVYTTDEPWDATLNRTDITGNRNNNKFYVIQLLRSIADPDTQEMFHKKFKSKTGVEWSKRATAASPKGKYVWIDRPYEVQPTDSKADIPSTLPPEIQALSHLIFSQSVLDSHLASMHYNAAKLPLGQLGKSAILKGFSVLKRIADVIENPDGDVAKEYGGADEAAAELSSEYYSIIPHIFGRASPIVITHPTTLKQELELMDSLWDMEVASKIMNAKPDNSANPINAMDARFLGLGISNFTPIQHHTREHIAINKYMHDTEVQNSFYDVDIVNLFRVERESETRSWNRAGHDQLAYGERLLLFHGSRSTNFAGILKEGLRIAPPEAPSSGYMFGRGVYFADMMSKSFNYCHPYLSDDTGLLLLCEVAAAPFYEQVNANYNADIDCREAKKRATKGMGRSSPANWMDTGKALGNDDLRGCIMPVGHSRVRQPSHTALQNNEYIVYSLDQVRLRYVVMVKCKTRVRV
ncbi:PARP-domain-containing protein [Mycena rebaudengoi]|nr:PARP-domain-containing protein [Mycena rebaudengoi]